MKLTKENFTRDEFLRVMESKVAKIETRASSKISTKVLFRIVWIEIKEERLFENKLEKMLLETNNIAFEREKKELLFKVRFEINEF